MKTFRSVLKAFAVVLCTFVCAIFVTICPLQSAFACENNQDFDSFYSSLMSIFSNYGDEKVSLREEEYVVEDGQIFVSQAAIEKYNLAKSDAQISVAQTEFDGVGQESVVCENFCAVDELEEKDGQVVVEKHINRLIVNSPAQVESFGAVAAAEFKDWHIFQYADHEQAQFAYENLSNSNLDVCFDFVVSAESAEEEDLDVEAGADLFDSHNSWADTFVGYDAFTSTTLTMHDKSSLPEIVVAVIDSGIYKEHELFEGRVLTQYGKSFLGQVRPPMTEPEAAYEYQDLFGHGTHVSGTIAEFTQSNVKILPLKALNYEGKGYGSMIVAALQYAIELKSEGVNIKVANMSLGIELSSNEYVTGYAALTKAIQDAKQEEIISVVSAGNERRDTGYSSPASVDEAFTVSALRKTTNVLGGNGVTFDSSYSNFGKHVDFAAPGTNIMSASNRVPNSYVGMSGTSMAAPHVSAAVALVLSNPYYANYSVDQVYDLLKENATDLGDFGRDDKYGYGCINLEKIGIERSGEVKFSETTKFHTNKFSLDLSYGQGENVEIYYTFGNAEKVDSSNGTLYERPIEISQTTKITAMGYFKDFEGQKLQVSTLSTMTYYFNNIDLLSNYDFKLVGSGYEISKYHGTDLTTLEVPLTYNSRSVVGVGSFAFDESKVECLNLPKSIQYISQSAFSENETLKEIHCGSSAVEVKAYAFNSCTNLSEFDIPNVTIVGDCAFLNCTSLKTLKLLQAKEIGSNAIAGSGIRDLHVGDNTLIGQQSDVDLDWVHGFAGSPSAKSDAEKLADVCGGNFEDLTLTITSDLNSTILIRAGETANFGMNFCGYDVTYKILLNGQVYTGKNVVVQVIDDAFGGEYDKWLPIRVTGLTNRTNTFQITLTDGYGNSVDSRQMEIVVVSDEQSTFSILQTGENYSISVTDSNGEKMTHSQNFYKSSSYMVEIQPNAGYVLESVEVKENGRTISLDEMGPLYAQFHLENVENDIEIDVKTRQELTVEFDIGQGVSILIDGKTLIDETSAQKIFEVKQNDTLRFVINLEDGFELKRVLLNGQRLDAVAENEFVLENISQILKVSIVTEGVLNKVTVSRGKGGTLSTNGEIEDDLAFGERREYHVTANEGYSVDSVTVNGKNVEVRDGYFVVEGRLDGCNIVVSFKKNGTSIFESDSVGLVYFFIFLALLFVFILAKIILSAVRKKQKKSNVNKK